MSKRYVIRYHVLIPMLLVIFFWVFGLMAASTVFAASGASLLRDDADLLTDKEESKLIKKLDKVSSKRDCDIAVITAGDLAGYDAESYVDDQIDSTGLGSGRENGTATLLIYVDQNDPSNREVRIATDQTANAYFSDADNDRVLDEIFDDLRSGDYADAVSGYADACDSVLGQSFDEGGSRGVSPGWLFGDLGIGALLAFAMGGYHRSRLKTSKSRTGASDYKVDGGDIQFIVNQDTFLDRHVERRKIDRDGDGPRDHEAHEAGTTHTTASGSHHGGAGRKF
ncbi:MAG: TPM domain-containing protein [Eubacterium sp.]|nr:TPM domain-containing protein [Eubacterium sp.]